MGGKDSGFSDDHNSSEPFEDRLLLDRHPEVLCFDDLYAAHRAAGGTQDINTFKNVLYSRLICALPLFANSEVVGDRLLLSTGCERLLRKLSPWTIGQRR